MESPGAVERLLALDRRIVAVCLALVTGLAWAYLALLAVRMHDGDMTSMGMAHDAAAMSGPQPWTAQTAGLMFAMWWIMMVGMMLPSAAPTVLLFGRIQRRQLADERPYARIAVFTLAYLIVWGAFSVLATAAQWGLAEVAWLAPMSLSVGGIVGAVLLVTGGVYQFTPLKRACLAHCRAPADFLSRHWRKGTRGAWSMGLLHGAYCLGCCWLIMGLLFVGGVMNLAWVAALALLVLTEKLVPRGERVARAAGALMIAAGLVLAVSTAMPSG